ncbi:MAG: diguanylate cyclase, partial [Clostridiales bacterium]|nr:diguanylate cyclase [Clostridiales bacterium]
MIDKMNYSMITKLISNVDAGLLFCKNDPHSTILYSNDYFFEMIGYTREEVEQLFHNRFAEMVIDSVPDILVKVKKAVELGEHLDYEYRMRRKDGTVMWIHDTAVYEKEHDAFYVVIMDITEKKSIQYQMEKLLWILDHIPNKIMIANSSDQKIDYVNTEVLNCEYLNEEPIEGNLLECVVGGRIIGQNFREIWKKALSGQVVSYETRFQEEEDIIVGHEKNYLVPILDHEKKIISIMQVSEDLMKQNDALTALPNRTMFENYYKEQRALGKENFDMTLFIIDIDDFKGVNDKYGHQVGDEVLIKLTKEVKRSIGRSDIIGRYGGEEF